jgi:hypothetical protein
MKKLLVLLMALAMIVSVKAIIPTPFTSGWADCAVANGNYGGVTGTCKVAWDGVTQACTEDNKDATFTVGNTGMTTTKITINHLNGISNHDGFEVKEGTNVLCTVPDVATDVETWAIYECDVNLLDETQLTLHPTAEAPWELCDTYGQVAIHEITYEAAPTAITFHGGTVCDTVPYGTMKNGWGVPAILGGVYGGASYDQFCLVWEPTCAVDTEIASVDMAFAGGNELITINHLDGMSDRDSFDVYVDKELVGHYPDSLNPQEDWVTTNFPANVAAGVHTVTLKVTDAAWNQCDNWGQLAIKSIIIVPDEDPSVPEFGLIAGVVAIAGLVAGVVVLRKRD